MDNILLDQVRSVIRKLEAPVSARETAFGWVPENMAAMKKILEGIEQSLGAGAPVQDINLSRAMDYWGIGGGELSEEIAAISLAIRN